MYTEKNLQENRTTILTRARLAENRQWLYLLAAGVGIFFLLPQIIGINRALRILGSASPLYLSLALGFEALRYVVSASTTRWLTRLFRKPVRFEPLVEAFFAGAAANRTFSTGGAPGMLVRLLYLSRQGISAGGIAVIFLIEDIAGFAVGLVAIILGVLALANVHPSGRFLLLSGSIFILGIVVLFFAGVHIYRRRAWVEKTVHWCAIGISNLVAWFSGRTIYDAEVVHRGVDEFYAGMHIARHEPVIVLGALGLNLLRYALGASALYFSFAALGWAITPGVLILLYTSASVLSTVSAVPGELALMGGSWAVLTLSFGMPRDTAMMALILSRTIAFWLPIPLGCAAFWNLRRLHYL